MTAPLYCLFIAMVGGAFCVIAGAVFACLWMSSRTNQRLPKGRWWDETDSEL